MSLQHGIGTPDRLKVTGFENGQPVHGRHHEFGFVPTYVVQSGRLKHAKVTLIAQWHVGSAYYSDSTNQVYRLLVTLPMRVF